MMAMPRDSPIRLHDRVSRLGETSGAGEQVSTRVSATRAGWSEYGGDYLVLKVTCMHIFRKARVWLVLILGTGRWAAE
jgi:hypothetical protein